MTSPRTEPQIFVKVLPEGRPAERVDLADRVLSFSYEDSEHKADKLLLSVDNWDLAEFDNPVWKKGNLLEVSWGYPENMAPTRQVVIQKVTGAQVLSVEAHGTAVLMNKICRCRTFEGLTRADAARRIARENGYAFARQDIEDTKHVIAVITQARMTDAQLLRRLADREGFEFYVDFDGLHFHQRRLGQRPTRVLRWYTPPEVGEILSFSIENDISAKPGAVDLRGRDPIRKQDIAERGSNTKTTRDTLAEVVEIVDQETGATRFERRNIAEDVRPTAEATSATAKREADARYRRTQQLTVELTATVIGDPSFLAKSIVELQGISRRLAGRYYLRETKHKIESGYTVELRALRDGHAELGGPPSKGKTHQPLGATTADPDALQPVEVVDQETGRTHVEFRDGRGRPARGER